MSRTAILSTLVVAGILTVGCDKVALLAPTQSTITLSVNTTTVASNGTAEVIATVVEQAGTAVHDGTEVTFTSSVGTVEPRVARTERGIARTTFRAGTLSGTARIGAFSGAAVATVVELLVGGAAAATVTVRTDPSSVPPTGGVVQVLAVVRDVSGNPLPGAQVVFTSDNGSLGSNSVIADQNGEARTTLNTNRQTVVKASVAGKEGQSTVSVVAAPTVGITASTPTPAVGVPMSFTITPGIIAANGNPISTVTFDPGDGTPARNIGTGTTTVSHTYTSTGSYTATATITDSGGNRAQSSVTVTAQRSMPVVTITGPSSAINVGDQASFTVNATAAPNGPPISSVVVTFPDGQSITLGPGQSTFLRSFSAPGTYVVRATATDQAGTQATAQTSVIVRPRATIEVTLDADQGDANEVVCTPPRSSNVYPKTCTVRSITLFGPGPAVLPARVVFTAGFPLGTVAPSNVTGYQWSFGDGTGETTTNRNTDHVYTRAGTYTVTVTVTTADGGTGSQRLTLIVQAPTLPPAP